jgi:hypothetical protein
VREVRFCSLDRRVSKKTPRPVKMVQSTSENDSYQYLLLELSLVTNS